MSTIQPFRSVAPSRQTGRELARLASAGDMALARTNLAADIEAAKLDAMQQVAGRALQGVAMVAQLEQQLSTLVPLAHSRLQAIADIHAVASADVVLGAARRLS